MLFENLRNLKTYRTLIEFAVKTICKLPECLHSYENSLIWKLAVLSCILLDFDEAHESDWKCSDYHRFLL